MALSDNYYFSIYEQLQYPKVDVVRAINERYLNVHVSIIVPVYNAFSETRKCLESISRAETPNTSVFVINDASSEAGFEKLASEYGNDKFIFLENRSGYLDLVVLKAYLDLTIPFLFLIIFSSYQTFSYAVLISY